MSDSHRRCVGVRLLSLVALGSLTGAVAGSSLAVPRAEAATVVLTDSTPLGRPSHAAAMRLLEDSLRGKSGKLLMRLVTRARSSIALPLFERFFGDSALFRPGFYALADSVLAHPFTFIALRPFDDKQGAHFDGYRLGLWPSERGRRVTEPYENPDGFIEVTPDNQDTQISEHFRLRDFLTHDQKDVWPKFLVLNEDLVDKLELVIEELERGGIQVRHVAVMSGFRTPWYNRNGGKTGGRAELSRHMYGDAADIFIDNDGNGRMDDLNHDGRVDSRDARFLLSAVEKVEREHPELIGGGAAYRSTRSHGPFAHIDVRGWRARWGRA